MDPLKDMFDRKFYEHFAQVFADTDKNFNATSFIKMVTGNLDALSLNGRLWNTAIVLKQHLPEDFKKAVDMLYSAAPALRKGYTALVLPDYIARYGKDHFDLSMEALRDFTSLGSSEFAIRVFLRDEPEKTLKVMHHWAKDQNHHVRRLASEGSRPRLPWSFKLEHIIKNPSLTTGILEQLKTDEELYVRKSVANHLNDLSKDNVPYLMQLLKRWDNSHPHTRWIIKHASRTLIKKGNQDSLSLFNFEKDVKVLLDKLTLHKHSIAIGEEMQFSFELNSLKNTPQKLVVDYAIHYAKASGLQAKKVFKLKEVILQPGQTIYFNKKQAFKDLTTRKHYMGRHDIEIMVNGSVLGTEKFDVVD